MEGLENQLKELATKIEGKSTEKANELIKAFEEKNNEFIAGQVKEVKEGFEREIEALKKHADELDVKLQAKQKKELAKGDVIENEIKSNFDTIAKVKKGSSANIEVKAVGDMALGTNLTGDQPRDYNFDVVMKPSQKINVSDLASSVTISGGTYTFPRETTSEGSIGAHIEGTAKSQIDYDIEMIDVNTDFIAGYSVYSKKMANNLPFLTSFLPNALRRDYAKAENSLFHTTLSTSATASTILSTGNTKEGMLIDEVAGLEDKDFSANGIVVRPSDWFAILKTAKQDLASVVTFEGGVLRVSGVPVYKATWLPTDKYIVGDWSRVKKVVTEGLSLEFSQEDSDNFRKNNVTARIEQQCALAVEQPEALIYGDFSAV